MKQSTDHSKTQDLIKNLVDEMRVSSDGAQHTVELVLNLKGDQG